MVLVLMMCVNLSRAIASLTYARVGTERTWGLALQRWPYTWRLVLGSVTGYGRRIRAHTWADVFVPSEFFLSYTSFPVGSEIL